MDLNYFKRLQDIKRRDIEVLLKEDYRGIWETAIKKYSDTAHFVYELLQNADDAGATRAEFDLDSEGLWFKHDGSVRFSITNPDANDNGTENRKLGHINAITSIGNSTKVDEQKIGKFGIGFKAVFAYTNTPHIYDDRFSFKLENYIVPIELETVPSRKLAGETLFYFPFDHPSKSKAEAYAEILAKLEMLFQPILFLRNLKEIRWMSEERSGAYGVKVLETRQFGRISASLLESWSVEHETLQSERIWLFETSAVADQDNSPHRLAVAYYIAVDDLLETGIEYKAFCFFPTKEETKLGFMVQAPFLLTDNREGIKSGESWNRILLEGLAELAAQSLVLLRAIGTQDGASYIHDGFLECIPYKKPNPQDAANKSRVSFDPFYHTILREFQRSPLLPGKDGKFFTKQHAYWASDPELVELFTDEQVSMLMDNPDSGWVFLSRGHKSVNQTNKPLEEYISSIVAEVVDPKKLIRRITAKFTEGQSDEWLLRFYAYLGGRRSYWDDKDSLALKRPILLNQKRKAVVPWDDGKKVFNIFLPVGRKTSYDTVRKEHAADPDAMEFFKALGIKAPDLGDEIAKDILPQYVDDFDYGNEDLLIQHLEAFLTYYGLCPAAEQPAFLERLKKIDFVATKTPLDSVTRWFRKPTDCYYQLAHLQSYFGNCGDVYLVDMAFYEEKLGAGKLTVLMEMFKKLGVADKPRLLERTVPYDRNSVRKFQLEGFEFSRTYESDNIIKDTLMEGLDMVVNHNSPETSALVWRYLLEHLCSRSWGSPYSMFGGSFTYCGKWRSYDQTDPITSTLIQILRTSNWLYNSGAELKSATEISIEELHPGYDIEHFRAKDLLEFLGIKSVDSDSNLSDDQRAANNLLKEIQRNGLSLEQVKELIKAHIQKARQEDSPNSLDEGEEERGEGFEPSLEDILKQMMKDLIKVPDISENGDDPNSSTNNKVEAKEDASLDEDDFTKPSIDLQKRHDRLKADVESQMKELYRLEQLRKIAAESEMYSFRWFKALLELEYLHSAEANLNGKTISLNFSSVELDAGSGRILILRHPNRYIPQSIEDIGDLHIQLVRPEGTTTLVVEVVSVKEYTLRAKIKTEEALAGIDLQAVTNAVIDVKNPVFILAELRRAFGQLPLDDAYNLRDNLSKQIKFIFGPPGTGKTTVLATQEIIPRMMAEEDVKILVLAPTNKAADVLTTRIIAQMGEDESYRDWLVRFGTSAEPSLENNSILKDNRFDIRTQSRNTTITTVARFAYDGFKPDDQNEKFFLKDWDWDFIIVDEASMVTLANIAFILYQRPDTQFIIAGDPFQIEPIVQVDVWKDMNIYSMVELQKFAHPTTVPHNYPVQLLTRQYRSVPSIGSVFSHFVYDGILQHHRSASSQRPIVVPGLEIKDINVVKFPVTRYESIYRPNRLNRSNYHIYSALFTVEFVQHLAGQIAKSYRDGYRIGIICPYRAQATLVEKMLAHLPKGDASVDVQVGTIHGFQGDECDLIVAMLNPPRDISTSTQMFLNKRNILNVAISRAKDYLFLLMPDDETANVENLQGIKAIERLVEQHAAGRNTSYSSHQLEAALFGNPNYVEENSFATSHQSVNVYSRPAKRYEVRCEEVAIDVQMGLD